MLPDTIFITINLFLRAAPVLKDFLLGYWDLFRDTPLEASLLIISNTQIYEHILSVISV
jgi:hypothetical protein